MKRAAPRLGWLDGPGSGVPIALLYLSVASMFLISPTALQVAGFNYVSEGGGALDKIHPGTWLAALAIAAALVRRSPAQLLDDLLALPVRVAIFLATCFLLLGFMLLIEQGPVTQVFDTFFLPIFLFLLITRLPEIAYKRLAILLHVLLSLNALLGLYEYLSGWRLMPLMAGTVLVEDDWRSSAFTGHPLTNALLTGAYLLMLSVGGGRDLPWFLRPLCFLVGLASMAAFGGRTSLVLTLVLLVPVALNSAYRLAQGARFDLLRAALLFLLSPALVGGVVLVADSGFFEALLNRFASDSGSASTRVNMLKLFDVIRPDDLWFGPSQTFISSFAYMEGFEFGIESFWVSFIMAHGAGVALFFFTGFLAFCWELVATARRGSILLLIFFLIVISSSVSLSAKTTEFGMFVAILLTLLRRGPEPQAADAPAAAKVLLARAAAA